MGVMGAGESRGTALPFSCFLLLILFRDMRRLSLLLILSGSVEGLKGSAMVAEVG